jgi:hypothetical protein
LFPRGDLMVCMIDDREDVWNYARNLICVQPYSFFKNTGDINDPAKQLAAKQMELDKPSSSSLCSKPNERKRKLSKNSDKKENEPTIDTNTTKRTKETISKDDNNSNDSSTSTNSTNSNLSSSSSSSDSSSVTKIQNSTKEQCEISPKDAKIRSEEDKIRDEIREENDNDDYLIYLEMVLRRIHDEYYKVYDKRLSQKNLDKNENEIDENDLPDIKKVLPLIRRRILENVVLTFSGVVPTGYNLRLQRCYIMARSMGAKINENLVLPIHSSEAATNNEKVKIKKNYEYSYDDENSASSINSSGAENKLTSSMSQSSLLSSSTSSNNEKEEKPKKSAKQTPKPTTHLIAAKYGTSKVHEAIRSEQKIHVVTPEWLIACYHRWIRCDETEFMLTKEYDYKNCVFHNEYNQHLRIISKNNKPIKNGGNSLIIEFNLDF